MANLLVNIGSGKPITILELANIMIKLIYKSRILQIKKPLRLKKE